MKKVLITGFNPFGGEKINPSFEAVKKLPDDIDGAQIIKIEIPTVFNKSIEKLKEIMEKENPDIVICVGQAGGRASITVERVAININDARIPDNENNNLIDERIFEDGQNAYFSNLPIKAIVKNIRKNNIPANVSNTAGTFVCNNLMYGLLYYIDKKFKNTIGGFIHVPYIPEQVLDKYIEPSMSLANIIGALEIAIKTILNTNEDIRDTGGTIC